MATSTNQKTCCQRSVCVCVLIEVVTSREPLIWKQERAPIHSLWNLYYLQSAIQTHVTSHKSFPFFFFFLYSSTLPFLREKQQQCVSGSWKIAAATHAMHSARHTMKVKGNNNNKSQASSWWWWSCKQIFASEKGFWKFVGWLTRCKHLESSLFALIKSQIFIQLCQYTHIGTFFEKSSSHSLSSASPRLLVHIIIVISGTVENFPEPNVAI